MTQDLGWPGILIYDIRKKVHTGHAVKHLKAENTWFGEN